MSLIKTDQEIEKLKSGGQILAKVRDGVASMVRPGISTMELEIKAREMIDESGARPAFLGYRQGSDAPEYPAALCTSVNEEIVHCAPSGWVLEGGDIVSIDLGIKYEGLYTDSAVTVPVGDITDEASNLLRATKQALQAGIDQVRPGNHVGDIAAAIEAVGRDAGYGVIEELIGHGVGHEIHEKPDVPNFGKKGTLEELVPGMVLAIEPMFTLGDYHIKFLPDGWSVVTRDGSLSAHFEHTVAVTEKGHIVLT